jgi:large subunit ribosomal protein L23
MAILDRFKKTDSAPKKTKVSSQKGAVATTSDASSESAVEKTKQTSHPRMASHANVLMKPHVSEKAATLTERGIYVFDVSLNANKVEIRKAVEAIYHVHVISVRTQRGIGKVMKRGKITGRRSAWKKALVELKHGETLALIEGV